MFVYVLINKVNTKVYVGWAKNVWDRWESHIACALDGSTWCVSNAIRKYGSSNFLIRILEFGLTSKQAKEREKYHIALRKSYPPNLGFGYNMTAGGDGGMTISSTPEETTRRRSESGKKAYPPERRKLYSERGKVAIRFAIDGAVQWRAEHPDKEAARIQVSTEAVRKRLTGVPKSEEHKQKLAISNKAWHVANPEASLAITASLMEWRISHKEENSKNLSAALKGKKKLPMRESTKEKLRESARNQFTTEVRAERSRTLQEYYANPENREKLSLMGKKSAEKRAERRKGGITNTAGA